MTRQVDPDRFGFSRRYFQRGPLGQLIELAPDACPNGHAFGPGRVLVGNQPCIKCNGRPHRTWTCRQ